LPSRQRPDRHARRLERLREGPGDGAGHLDLVAPAVQRQSQVDDVALRAPDLEGVDGKQQPKRPGWRRRQHRGLPLLVVVEAEVGYEVLAPYGP
jgi:hypothetical protein